MEINIIPKFLDSALTPVAKEAGERLADIVSLVFTPVIKAKAKRDKNIELFLKELDEKISKIPEKQLQNPPLYIVGPIIDSVFKFYHDEEHIRKMYADLIASSMNLKNKVHPCYIEVIKQLSSIDANVLCAHMHFIYSQSPCGIFGDITQFIAFNVRKMPFDCNIIPPELYYLNSNKIYNVIFSLRDTLEVLIRLGLIDFKKEKKSLDFIQEYDIKFVNPDNCKIYIYVYYTSLTAFGQSFINVCCPSIDNKHYFIENSNNVLDTVIFSDDGLKIEYKK